jgi:hypothetical protein
MSAVINSTLLSAATARSSGRKPPAGKLPAAFRAARPPRPFAPMASPVEVAHYERSGCYRLERQLPGGYPPPTGVARPFHGAREKLR